LPGAPIDDHKGLPLIRVKPDDLTRAGVQRTPRVVGVKDGKPVLSKTGG